MNMMRALGDPFKLLNTALRPHIAGQRVQLAASSTKSANNLCFILVTL
jgi:hypothetical protein